MNYKRISKLINDNVPYAYICLSLKDSYVQKGCLITSISNNRHNYSVNMIVDDISRKTSGVKLPYRYGVVDGPAAVAAQARIIIRCPGGWTSGRFCEVVRSVCDKNPACDLVISCEVKWSSDMDIQFLK